jgi:hypothetical protein
MDWLCTGTFVKKLCICVLTLFLLDCEDEDKTVEDQVKKGERLLDQEIEEINQQEEINLHTPKARRYRSHKKCNFDTPVAQAIQNQRNERGKEMEIEWEEKQTGFEKDWSRKRKAVEHKHQESLEEQASMQVSLIPHKTENARRILKRTTKQLTNSSRICEAKTRHFSRTRPTPDTLDNSNPSWTKEKC